MKKRKQYSAAFKAKVALEAMKEEKTPAEIGSSFEIHPTLVSKWRQKAEKDLVRLFEEDSNRRNEAEDLEQVTSPLYKQIGQLTVEVDFLKKACDKLGLPRGKNA